MTRLSINGMVATVVIFGVAACAQTQRDQPPPSAPVAAPVTMEGSGDGYEEMVLMAHGAMTRDVEELRSTLSGLFDTDDLDPERLSGWLNAWRSGEANWADVPPSLRGIGGFSVAQLLEIYLAEQDSTFLEMTVRGKIQDYLYDEPQQSGHLSVATWVDYFDSQASFDAETPDRTERYHWDIDITTARDFRVIPRDDSQPTNPFPGTFDEWAPETLDRIFNGDSSTTPPKPPLINKLWAKGKGIVVRNVYRVEDDSSVQRLPNTDARYVSTDESCVDMMWATPVPAVMSPSFTKPNYNFCLGRCGHPLVVNTDG